MQKGKAEDLVVHEVPCKWVLFKVPTIPMMSDSEEDLDDFPMRSTEHTSENGAFRAESTDQWTATSGITTKIPRLFNGLTSRFKYEELIDDWLDLTMLEAGKRGLALKDRLIADAAMYKGLLDRESVRAEEVFQRYVETPLHQRSSECFPLEILSIYPSKRRKH